MAVLSHSWAEANFHYNPDAFFQAVRVSSFLRDSSDVKKDDDDDNHYFGTFNNPVFYIKVQLKLTE